jgi:DNA-binding response OmpR family regulator
MGEGQVAEPAGDLRDGWAVASIAVIADEGERRRTLRASLESEGFDVSVGLEVDTTADAFIVDFGLSGRSAAAVCTTVRRRSVAPILVIADRPADESSLQTAFDVGADHVAPAGSTDREVIARLRALLRRYPPRRRSASTTAADGPISVQRQWSQALVHGIPVPLSRGELEVLSALIDRAGRVLSRPELFASGWIDGTDDRSLDFFMRRLRQKVEAVDTRRRIVAIRGVGFRLDVDDPVSPLAATSP